VADALRARGHEVELVKVTTHGDVSTAPLASLGGAGVFVGAVRAAVLAGEADLAVHSFKDLPTAAAAGLMLAAVPRREDPADALCAPGGLLLAGLPAGARVGTGSPRRAAQLLSLRPDLDVVEIRGNVETRLRRASEDLDAVVLAAAGLRRLGRADAISERLDPSRFLPAPAQGALAVECRSDASPALRTALAALDHRDTRLAALAERAVLARLGAGCAAPVAAYAQVGDGRIRLSATVIATDGSRQVTRSGEASGEDAEATALGTEVADLLVEAGAAGLVDLSASKPGPLAGRVVLVPERAPEGTTAALSDAGATVLTAAVTGFEPLDVGQLDTALAEHWDWIVVTSAQTAATLAANGFDLAGRLRGARVAAVGPATASALRSAGIDPDLVARPGGGAALVAAFAEGPGRVLLPGAAHPSTEPTAGLVAKGWDVRNVAVYRTVALPLPDSIVQAWRGGRIDAFVVTAASVARAAAEACGLPGPRVVAIGTPSAAAAAQAGLDVAAVAVRPDAASIADALLAALA
jgi:hydroxymethylbilane synthase